MQPASPKPTAPTEDVENPAPAPPAVSSVLQRWKRDDLKEKGGLLLRSLACLFSLLSFVVMASNRHGDWKEFDKYEEYRYLVAVGVLAFLYSALQVARQGLRVTGGAKDLWSQRTSAIVDFAGDQVVAYLLMSALSAAIPMTNRMREGADNLFTDATSASISMAFFAFAALALSAVLSGHKLSTHSYI